VDSQLQLQLQLVRTSPLLAQEVSQISGEAEARIEELTQANTLLQAELKSSESQLQLQIQLDRTSPVLEESIAQLKETSVEADERLRELAEENDEIKGELEDAHVLNIDLEAQLQLQIEINKQTSIGNGAQIATESAGHIQTLVKEVGQLKGELEAAHETGIELESQLETGSKERRELEDALSMLREQTKGPVETAYSHSFEAELAESDRRNIFLREQLDEAKNDLVESQALSVKFSAAAADLEQKLDAMRQEQLEEHARIKSLQAATIEQFKQLHQLSLEQTERHAAEVQLLEDKYKKAERQMMAEALVHSAKKVEAEVHRLRVSLSRKDLALSRKTAELTRITTKVGEVGGGPTMLPFMSGTERRSSRAQSPPSGRKKGWTTGFHHTHAHSPGFGAPPPLRLSRGGKPSKGGQKGTAE